MVIAAVDIGGTKIAVGAVNDHGRLLSREEIPTDAGQGYTSTLDQIGQMVRQVGEASGAEISGIGIGSTGPLDPVTGEFGDVDFLPGWRGQNPVRDLQQIFSVPVAMENDGDAAALGESAWGAARNKSRLIYITVGTGIGGGFIFDGELYRGVDHAHPEVGHQVIDASGPDCSCGFRGCWESLAGGPAMVAWMEGNRPAGHQHHGALTAKRICELAREGDPVARKAVEREAHYLGLGVANLITLFTPDAIVLGGSVMKNAVLFLDGMRKTIARGCRFVPFGKADLMLASLGEDSNLIGAASVWHHRFRPHTNG